MVSLMTKMTMENLEVGQSPERVLHATTVKSQNIFRESVENIKGIRIKQIKTKKRHRVDYSCI